ncbi:MAG: flagellar biosynthetic protein FliO [Desulfosarcina sp.]
MNGSPDMMMAGLKMIASLGVVLAVILFLMYGFRKLARQRLIGDGDKRIQVLESHYMGVKKSIALVRVPGKVLVLGITGDRIDRLDSLAESDVESRSPLEAPTSFGPVFNERLRKLSGGLLGKEPR